MFDIVYTNKRSQHLFDIKENIMKKGYSGKAYGSKKSLTPRQKQLIFRKAAKTTLLIALLFSIVIGTGIFSLKSKAADTYNKYYTSVTIMPGDTISEYYRTYGEHYQNFNDYCKEVCMINNIDEDDICAGNFIILPYYSQENK